MKTLKWLPLLLLFSCRSNESGNTDASATNGEMDTSFVDTSLAVDMDELPALDPNKNYKGNILQTTEYHSDEVMEDVEDLEWLAIVKYNKSDYRLEAVDVSAERVNDGILDDPDEKTGWSISTDADREVVLLINGIDFLFPRHIQGFKLTDNRVDIGESEELIYKDATYKFSAKGKEEGDEYYTFIQDYELYLTYKKDGIEKRQLITKVDSFDDAMTQVLFIGDIDGDDILDLIIDNTDHYNVMLPTLFLSRPADENEILKKVAAHQSVGC